MDIGDLIRIGLFVFFIVVPILRAVGRNQQRGKQNTKVVPPKKGQAIQTQQAKQASPPQTDEFSRRLEEARKRVQQAFDTQSQAQPSQTTPSAGTLTSAEPANELFGDHHNEPIFEHEAPQRQPVMPTFLPPESETSHTGFDERSRPLQIQRLNRKKRAKIESANLLELDERSILSGILWHQILSEPSAKRGRRNLFRRQ